MPSLSTLEEKEVGEEAVAIGLLQEVPPPGINTC